MKSIKFATNRDGLGTITFVYYGEATVYSVYKGVKEACFLGDGLVQVVYNEQQEDKTVFVQGWNELHPFEKIRRSEG